MALIETPVIITFANQKGGVGKTTLCVLFANYLVSKGVSVRIMDCDMQQSIMKCRKANIECHPTFAIPYPVERHELKNNADLNRLIKELFEHPEYDVALIDTPGYIDRSWIAGITANSDYMVIPMQSDYVPMASTCDFLGEVNTLRNRLSLGNTRFMVIPNNIDKRIGRRSELIAWEKARTHIMRIAEMLPNIGYRADLKRLNTLAHVDSQVEITAGTFDKMYEIIFGTREPMGKPVKLPNVITRAPKNKTNNDNNDIQSSE